MNTSAVLMLAALGGVAYFLLRSSPAPYAVNEGITYYYGPSGASGSPVVVPNASAVPTQPYLCNWIDAGRFCPYHVPRGF